MENSGLALLIRLVVKILLWTNAQAYFSLLSAMDKKFYNLAKISNCIMVKSEESAALQWDGQTIKIVKVEVSGLYLYSLVTKN